jgi:predicted transcriptional regulator
LPNRRTRLEIYFDVLRAIRNGNNRKNRIMQAAYVSWTILNELLNSLVSQGFIEEIKTLHWRDKRIRLTYDFTPRGEKMMSYLEYNEKFLKEIDLRELFKDRNTRI